MSNTNSRRSVLDSVMFIVPNLGLGGQQRVAIQLATLIKSDRRVLLVVFDADGMRYDIPEGVTFINLDIGPATNVVRRIIHLCKRSVVLRRIKKEQRVRVSIGIGYTADLANCLSRYRDRVISTIHGSLVLERGRTLVDDVILRLSDKVIFVSKGQKEYYKALYKSYTNLSFCYNPCDIDCIRKKALEPVDIAIDEWTFTSSGRLTPGKCFLNLINVFRVLKYEYPNIRLLIIGEGEQQNELEKYIRELGLEDTVFLMGYKNNPFAYIAKSRGYCFSSSREAFPLSVVEGLACGVPVISTDCRFGPREVLASKHEYVKIDKFEVADYGILTPAFQSNQNNQIEREKEYANAIVTLIENSELEKQFRLKALQRCEEFALNRCTDFWRQNLEY